LSLDSAMFNLDKPENDGRGMTPGISGEGEDNRGDRGDRGRGDNGSGRGDTHEIDEDFGGAACNLPFS
jgi:hypothetical protein